MSASDPSGTATPSVGSRILAGLRGILFNPLLLVLGVILGAAWYVTSDLTLGGLRELVFSGATIALPVIGTVAVWAVGLAIAAVGGFVIVISTVVEEGRADDADGPRLPALQNAATVVQALAGGVALMTLWFLRETILANRWTILVGLGVLFASWVVYVYLSNRRSASRRSTAIRRTQRNVGNTVENWAEAILGAVFVIAAIVLSVLSAGFEALGSLDQFLTPILDELAFWAITALGYVQLGGERLPGSQFIPSLNALQWVGIAVLLFAGVVVFRD
jgi:hypothetical protein